MNRYRGEIEAEIGGKRYCLALTLGGLAELENRFGAASLSELVERICAGSLTSEQLIAILAAGLRGGGNAIDDAEVATMRLRTAVPELLATVTRLLNATFGSGDPPSGGGGG